MIKLLEKNSTTSLTKLLFLLIGILSVSVFSGQKAAACIGNPNCDCSGISNQQDAEETIQEVGKGIKKYFVGELGCSGKDSLCGSFGGTQIDLLDRFIISNDLVIQYDRLLRNKNDDGAVKIYDSNKDGAFFNRNNSFDEQIPSETFGYSTNKDTNRRKYINDLTKKIENYERIVKYCEENKFLEAGKFSNDLELLRKDITKSSHLAYTNLQKRYNIVGIISPTLSTVGDTLRGISDITNSYFELDPDAKNARVLYKVAGTLDKAENMFNKLGTVGKVIGKLTCSCGSGAICIGSGLATIATPDISGTTKLLGGATSFASGTLAILGAGGVLFDGIPIYNKKAVSINKELNVFENNFSNIKTGVDFSLEQFSKNGTPYDRMKFIQIKGWAENSANAVLNKFMPKNRTFRPTSINFSKNDDGEFNEKTPMRSPQCTSDESFKNSMSCSAYICEKNMMGISPGKIENITITEMNDILLSNEVVPTYKGGTYVQPKQIPSNENGIVDFIFLEMLPKGNINYFGTIGHKFCNSDCSFSNLLLTKPADEEIKTKDVVNGLINDMNRDYNRLVCKERGIEADLNDSRVLFIKSMKDCWLIAREKDFGGGSAERKNIDIVLFDSNDEHKNFRTRIMENEISINDWKKLDNITTSNGNFLKSFFKGVAHFHKLTTGRLFQKQCNLLGKILCSNNNSFTVGELNNLL